MDFVTVSTGLILPYWMGLPMRNIHSDLPSQVIVLLPLVTEYKLNKIFNIVLFTISTRTCKTYAFSFF